VPKSSRDGLSKPFRRTPKLGNSQAAKLANMATIETTDGLRTALGRRGMFIFVALDRVAT